jgi:hypothetical protein
MARIARTMPRPPRAGISAAKHPGGDEPDGQQEHLDVFLVRIFLWKLSFLLTGAYECT